jgi:glyoxylase-like metal-dependent hydrolase (beta-lactamase superfamily II)
MAETSITTLDLKFQNKSNAIASYMLRHSSGVVLIECGPGSCIEALKNALATEGFRPGDVTHILLTHIHLDHAGSAGWWSRQGAQIIVHPIGAPHLIHPEKLLASAGRIYGDRMSELWGEFLPVLEEKLTILEDEQEIIIGSLRFTPINTPGHAEHHYAYLWGETLFSGDIGGVRIPGFRYLRVPMPPPELNLERWRRSVGRLREIKFQSIAPTHFGIYSDPEWQLNEVEKGIDAAELWLAQVMASDPPLENLRQSFTDWMATESVAIGLSEDVMRAYELANPPGMSADGLYRYWKKAKSLQSQDK